MYPIPHSGDMFYLHAMLGVSANELIFTRKSVSEHLIEPARRTMDIGKRIQRSYSGHEKVHTGEGHKVHGNLVYIHI